MRHSKRAVPPVNDNDVMADQNAVTRRSLARLLAVAALAPQAGNSQATPSPDADLDSAREQLRGHFQQIAKVKVPMSTEPACHFKA